MLELSRGRGVVKVLMSKGTEGTLLPACQGTRTCQSTPAFQKQATHLSLRLPQQPITFRYLHLACPTVLWPWQPDKDSECA